MTTITLKNETLENIKIRLHSNSDFINSKIQFLKFHYCIIYRNFSLNKLPIEVSF